MAFRGQLSPAALTTPIDPIDKALDHVQLDAVARAVHSPDLQLIAGAVGTGKTRVAVELVRQVVARNGRVLFLSPEPERLDPALGALATDVGLVRRLGPEERADVLPADVAALIAPSRRTSIRTQLLHGSTFAMTSAEQRLKQAEAVHAKWAELTALQDRRTTLLSEREALVSRRAAIVSEIEREAGAIHGPASFFMQRLHGAVTNHARRIATLDAAGAELQTARLAAQKALDAAKVEVRQLRPRADALQHRRWHTLAFWQARSDRTLADRLLQAESRAAAAQSELSELCVREQKLTGDRRLADDDYAAERSRWLDAEATRRRAELDTVIVALDGEIALSATQATELREQFAQFQANSLADAAAAEPELSLARQELRAAQTKAFAIAARIDELVEEACASVAVVAGPVASIATDADVLAAAPFDLLIIDDAHMLTEGDFLSAARVARRWVLVGESRDPASGRWRGQQPGLFARLLTGLRQDVWTADADHLICHLYPLRPGDRKRLECEPVADAPDIELRLFTPPNGSPTLAEVVFPASTTPTNAREYLFREMGEVTCAPRTHTIVWEAASAGCVARFGPIDPEATFADIGDRIREELSGLETRAVHFTADWSRDQAEHWITEHVGQREPGRVVILDNPYRACPGLARWLNLAFDLGLAVPSVADEVPHVEFLAVPDMEQRRRRDGAVRSGRVGGAGYEIDLADPRQRVALSADFPGMPATGFVNVHEAQAIVRYLESAAISHVAITSPFPSQVALLRHLVTKSPRLAQARVLDAGEAARQECDVLVVSLTRSHVSRAVTFGDDPSVLAKLTGRARKKVLFAGDPGTLARRLQWEGPVDHLNAANAARERSWIAALADCPRVSPPRRSFRLQ
jgi:hypothetical protein